MTTKNPPPAATPYLCCKGAAEAIAFYEKAFGAKQLMCMAEPNGRIGHAEIEIAGAVVMLSDEYPDHGVQSPTTLGGSPVGIHVYVDDVDAVMRRAEAAGAQVLRPPADQFYGDRAGQLRDPFGHKWYLATRKEEVSTAEMKRRYDEMMKQGAS